MTFNAMHSVSVRTPYEIKRYGQPDRPYTIAWDYPVMRGDKCVDVRRRHTWATADQALSFTIKHRIPTDRLPYAIRKKLCEHAHTVRALTSTSTAPCARSSAASVDGGCRGS